jgi:hypothetical protein
MRLVKLRDVEFNKEFAVNPNSIVELWPLADGEMVRITINAGGSTLQRTVAGPLEDVLSVLGEG